MEIDRVTGSVAAGMGDASSVVQVPSDGYSCAWCRRAIGATARADSRFCRKACRQAAFRLRRRALPELGDASPRPIGTGDASPKDLSATRPLRFAYADPPYPGLAARYYRHEPDFAGEVDHASLIDRLATGGFDGWALSTSARALREILPLCPPEARVCAWMKPKGIPPATRGLHNSWEPLIVLQGRRLRPGRGDLLIAHAARGGGSLPGRKPIAFCAWLFKCLGMLPGDELVDLFPGTGIVGDAWRELSSSAARDASSGSCLETPATDGGAA